MAQKPDPAEVIEQLRAEAVVWRGVQPPAYSTVYDGTPLADLLDRAAAELSHLTEALEQTQLERDDMELVAAKKDDALCELNHRAVAYRDRAEALEAHLAVLEAPLSVEAREQVIRLAKRSGIAAGVNAAQEQRDEAEARALLNLPQAAGGGQ